MSKWTTSFALAQREQPKNFFDFGPVKLADKTIRFEFPARFDGSKLRVRLSNCENKQPYTFGGVTAHVLRDGKCVGGVELTFPTHELPPDGVIDSEPANLEVKHTDTIALTYYLPDTPAACSNVFGSVAAEGDRHGEAFFEGETIDSVPLLAAVDLMTADDCHAIAAFGDSITQMRLWTDHAAARAAELAPGKVTFLNLGIGGNRLLRDTHFARTNLQFFGRSGLKRFAQDAASLSGVTRVFAALGCNDISQPDSTNKMAPPIEERCTIEELTEGAHKLRDMITAMGAEPVFCTITPFGGMTSFDEESEGIRLAANALYKELGKYVDFATATEDTNKPGYFIPECNSGDNLHPSPEGGRRMAASIPDEYLK